MTYDILATTNNQVLYYAMISVVVNVTERKTYFDHEYTRTRPRRVAPSHPFSTSHPLLLPLLWHLPLNVQHSRHLVIILNPVPGSRQYSFMMFGPRSQTSPTTPRGAITSPFMITTSLIGVGRPLFVAIFFQHK